MSDIALSANSLSKDYYIYKRASHRVFEALNPFSKQLHTSFSALSDINFEVKRGESVGIIGRNGSGKSTLLQIVCGNLQATGGSVAVNGRISALLELGSGFNPEFTGRENVYLNTAILGMSKQETDARFEQITEFADIGDFIERPVKTYSSGMNARLAFSTAIAVDPDILIIDEALAVGDIFFQQKCVAHMKKMMDGCTILLVSHDMHSVTNMCDRVIVLDKGKVVFSGNPPEGVAKYTKLIHSREAKKKRGLAESDVLPKQILKAARDTAPDFDLWEEVSDEDRGGSGEINILHYSVTNEGQPITMVQSGDRVSIRLLIQSLASKKDIIFGYTIKDRVGNAIFGENSLCLEDAHFEFDAGYSIVSYDFIWPEVYPDNYTLTIGIGEGTHPLSHKVQCWAHNIVSFKAVTSGVSIHGMFNNPLEQVDVSPLISDSSTV